MDWATKKIASLGSILTWSDLKKCRLSALLFLMIVFGILLVHFMWLAPVLHEGDALASQISQQTLMIEKYRNKLDQAQYLKTELEKQEGELKHLREGLFPGSDPYQMAASLGELFSSQGSQELNMKSYQVLDSKEYGLYQEVRIKFYFMASIKGLHTFLQSLHETQTVIAVDQMDIRKGGTKGGPDLVVNVILAALMEKGEKS